MESRLLVLGKEKRGRKWYYECLCSCGNTKYIYGYNVDRGITRSCGCLIGETTARFHLKHGLSRHRLSGIHHKMVSRCHNEEDAQYRRYGGRGIEVCPEWRNSLENFVRDMYPTFKEGLTLDRTDNNKGYSKENCRWATLTQQQRNRRCSQFFMSPGGEAVHLFEMAERLGVSPSALRYRHQKGLTGGELLRVGKKPIRDVPRKNTIWVEFRGITKSLPQWCYLLNINYRRTNKRLRLGWSAAEAFGKEGEEWLDI